ncbi:MAG: hypothetical protein COV08_01590 [Candidatus Vogelbacteria bacterium CG10_big_fil_rev_8_21_14_0_10_49_38]|uniref:PASTA domain-containing protein n=1 Tax=Candidatus Vogelbacteria bacterium CG10_big_fil_rev_8_21_14_0_10_49_38 TaxID=1975043 RepID=A0A2H0RHR1_9BACT|nr:MAG: hypothetical protein BK006_01605 [bacterium CG10_49_38]PIR46091.1 MAG: hypothetical protein COV08_01590 [Candidatus Vogelbacteria bacterium CG10_big_fil_rev_8_21_14_0_10_49_38]
MNAILVLVSLPLLGINCETRNLNEINVPLPAITIDSRFVLSEAAANLVSDRESPFVTFTYLPVVGSDNVYDSVIYGMVYGVDPSQHQIASYLKVDGNFWSRPAVGSLADIVPVSGPLSFSVYDGIFAQWVFTYSSSNEAIDDWDATEILTFVVPKGTVVPACAPCWGWKGDPVVPEAVTSGRYFRNSLEQSLSNLYTIPEFGYDPRFEDLDNDLIIDSAWARFFDYVVKTPDAPLHQEVMQAYVHNLAEARMTAFGITQNLFNFMDMNDAIVVLAGSMTFGQTGIVDTINSGLNDQRIRAVLPNLPTNLDLAGFISIPELGRGGDLDGDGQSNYQEYAGGVGTPDGFDGFIDNVVNPDIAGNFMNYPQYYLAIQIRVPAGYSESDVQETGTFSVTHLPFGNRAYRFQDVVSMAYEASNDALVFSHFEGLDAGHVAYHGYDDWHEAGVYSIKINGPTSLTAVFVTKVEEERVLVPDLIGLTETQAIAKIGETCFVVGQISRLNSQTVPAGRVVNWSFQGLTEPCGAVINLTVSLGPATPPEMLVTITSPAPGLVYEVGALVPVRVIATGDSAGGPYKLVVRNAELSAPAVSAVILDFEYSFNFTLNLEGSGYFTAYLESASGASTENYLAYSVVAVR